MTGDAQDGKWYVSEVLSIDANKVLVHFVGWTSRWDLWVPMEDSALAPLYTHTNKSARLDKWGSLPFWRVDDVCRFISTEIELPQYERAFREMSVDGEMLAQLSEDELVSELGIDVKLHRKKILTKIEKLNKSGDS
jgi:hypothetical protein